MEGTPNWKNCTFLSFDVDLTGNKLYDEITNMGVYGKEASFQQYVIPYRNINIYARRKYLLKTVNIHDFRVLRDLNSKKIIKTKTEIFALFDFLTFLESQNTKNAGICLMCFEPSRLVPFILIEALNRYKLLDRFKKTVRGFVDCYGFVKDKCASSIPKFSLRTLAKILLNRDSQKFNDAFERTRLVYEIVMHLSEGETQNKSQDLAIGVAPFSSSVDKIATELEELKDFLQKQKTITPLFLDQFKVPNLRVRAIELRKLLSGTDITYESLKTSFQQKEDLKELVRPKFPQETPDKDVSDLVNIITGHFQKLLTEKPKPEKHQQVNNKKIRNPKPKPKPKQKAEKAASPSTAEQPPAQTSQN